MSDSQQLGMNLPNTQPMESVEQYQFEPIKGYPMLQWRGKRPFSSTQYYPAQLKEVHGAEVEGWHSKVYWGDNIQVMSHLLKEFRGKVNLVYIDPPFDSKADYKKQIKLKGTDVSNDQNAFEEKQYSDIWTNDEYLQFMYERLILVRELMSECGTLYLHCDWRRVHYLHCIIDEIFSSQNLMCQIVWKRSSIRKASSNKWLSVDDTILVATRSDNFVFNTIHLPYSEEYKKRFNQKDEHGYYYWIDIGTYSQERLERLKAEGRVRIPENPNANPRIKHYLHEGKGVQPDNVWTDIIQINSQAKEDTKYPTQKPETLLERIIKASSNPGDIVFDCFMGSGTTQAVAMKLGRRFIGADINLGAVQITTKRLLGVAAELETHQQQGNLAVDAEADSIPYYTGFEVYNVNHYDVFRNPLQAKDLLLEALEVNRLEQGNLFDGEKDGRMVKIMPINRITTRADLNELIAGFDYKAFQRRQQEHPHKPVEKITLVCMGHEPDLAAQLKREMKPFELDVEVVDILRDKSNLEFKRDSEAKIAIQGQMLVIEKFYPMNLLQKLSLQQENVDDWRELVESVMIDWNFDGAILEPKLVDIPGKNELVKGSYPIPDDAGTIRIRITDLLSESLEEELQSE